MARICPLTNDVVLYLECLECDDRAACRRGRLNPEPDPSSHSVPHPVTDTSQEESKENNRTLRETINGK